MDWHLIESAPADKFVLLYCPEDDTRWLAKLQHGRWRGHDENGNSREGMGPEDVTGWKVTHWAPLPDKPEAA